MEYGLAYSPISLNLVSCSDPSVFLEIDDYYASNEFLNKRYDGEPFALAGKLKHVKSAANEDRYLLVPEGPALEEGTDIATALSAAKDLDVDETSEEIYYVTNGYLSFKFPHYCIAVETVEVKEDDVKKYDLCKLANAFADFEPYMFGEDCTPDKGQYEPMGDLADIKNCYQALNPADTFCKEIKLNNYRLFEGKEDIDAIIGIEKGTAPKYEKDQENYDKPFWSTTNPSYSYTDEKQFYIWGDDEGIYITQPGNVYVETFGLEKWKQKGISFVPKRIGVVLVGAGGGSSGSTCSDIKRGDCCGANHIIVPGTGGGGGAVALAVLNLEGTSEERYFIITLGIRGNSGSHAKVTTGDDDYHQPTSGGQSGGSATIELFDERLPDNPAMLLEAGGGFGGKVVEIPGQTDWEAINAVGGAGGIVNFNYRSLYEESSLETRTILKDTIWLKNGKPGGHGRGYNGNEDLTEALSEPFSIELEFLSDDTEDENYSRTLYREGKKGKLPTATDDDVDYLSARVPGGNSYGYGGYTTFNADGDIIADIPPGIGGGGLSMRDSKDNPTTLQNERMGGNSYVALYY